MIAIEKERFRYMFRRVRRVLSCTGCLAIMTSSVLAQTDGAAAGSAAGQPIFTSTCAACHGLDGRGGEHAPNIAGDSKIQAMSDAALLEIIKNGIPTAGMPGFGSSLDGTQIGAVLKYLRALQGTANQGLTIGDASQGRVLFFGKAGCSNCHMVNGHGGFLGAELSAYGKGHSPATIRDAIVDPNKNLDTRRGTVTVVTRSGKTLRGVIRNEDNFSLQMQTADGRLHLFDKSDLTRIEHERSSLMPADYGSKLTSAERNDLVSFLSQIASNEKAGDDEDDEQE